MDPRNAAMDSANPGRKQHRLRLARFSKTLLPPVYRYPGGLHSQEIPYPTEDEIPRHRLLHSRLRAKRPKSSLPPRITRDESTILSWATTGRSRRRHEISFSHHVPRAHREGPR